MLKSFSLPAMSLLLAFFCSRAAAGDARGEYSQAVPPATVMTDSSGDYILDEPFPQWAKETPSPAMYDSASKCSTDPALIPDWARPLPVEPVTCATAGPGGEIWAATPDGLIFLDSATRSKLYFAGKRWLPDNNVESVGAAPDGSAIVRTAGGDSVIARRPMTLEQKAAYFEKVMRERHNRDGMFADCALRAPGDLATFELMDDDNDGQWTEMYLAAESFRYAATGDPEALANARAAFGAMERLLTVSPAKGFPARSVLPASRCPGRDPQGWRMLADGSGCWKSDTSVDELVGHYFGLPIFYDLAADESEKERIRELIRDLTNYIISHGFRLVDEKGNVTSDGHWDPEWMNTEGRLGDQGLNSLQALSALRSAYHVVGDEKYLEEYRRLINEHGYSRNALNEKKISDRYQVNHDSDEMAFLSFYNLARYETDPELRDKYYIEGMRRAWKNDLPERNAEQITIYGAFARRNFGLDLAARSLREIPLDLVKWGSRNSRRADVAISQKLDRFGRRQTVRVLPFTEIAAIRWSENLYLADSDGDGRSEAMATFWLLPYWMARYHGMIR